MNIGELKVDIKRYIENTISYKRTAINAISYDAATIASGNGNAEQTNTYAHAYASAELAYKYGYEVAKYWGDQKEKYGPQGDVDNYKDYYNNEVGRRIGEWLRDRDLPIDYLDDMIQDAYDSGDLLTQIDDNLYRSGSNDLYSEGAPASDPTSSPTWSFPTPDMPGSSAVQIDNGFPLFLPALPTWEYLGSPLTAMLPVIGALSDLYRQPPVSPLILDLDYSNNIELMTLAHSNTFFDLDGDGFAEFTGWTAGGDGFLAVDRNADGVISDITELFGDELTDGFVALAELDDTVNGGNGDGVIDANDAQFTDLRIWQDANSNGVTDDGELKTLAEWNITSINLNASAVDYTIAGHHVSSESSFTMDGVAHVIKDVWFENNQAYSFASLPDNFSYDEDVYDLPNLRGYGDVPDLWVAMTQDASLLSAVQALVGDDYSTFNYGDFHDAVEEILLRWTGGDAVASNSRGTHADAQHVVAIEAIMGQGFLTASNSSEPDIYCGPLLEDAWTKIVDHYATSLLTFIPISVAFTSINDVAIILQTEEDNGNPVDEMTEQEIATLIDSVVDSAVLAMENHPLKWLSGISYDYLSDGLIGDLPALIEAIEGNEPSTSIDKDAFWQDMLPVINAIADAQQLSAGDYEAALDGSWLETLVSDGPLVQLRYANTYIGTSGNDSENYSYASDGYHSQFIATNEGDDYVHAAYGANTFYYNLGDGHDEFYTWEQDGDKETLLFGKDIQLSDIYSISRHLTTNAVVIRLLDGGSIQLDGQLGGKDSGIEFFEFYNGARYSKGDFYKVAAGIHQENPSNIYYAITAGDVARVVDGIVYEADATYLNNFEMYLDATTSDIANTDADALYQSQRYGYAPFSYSFAIENGTYEVELDFAELNFSTSGHRLLDIYAEGNLIETGLDVFDEAGGQYAALQKTYTVTVDDGVMNLTFDASLDSPMVSGIVIRSQDVEGTSAAESIAGTNLSEALYGHDGNDTLSGAKGNDLLYGGAGDDQYVHAEGDGNDTINDTSGTDTLVLDGVDSDDAVFLWYGEDGLRIDLGNGEAVVVEHQFLSGHEIDSFVFDDATLSATDVANLNPAKVGTPDNDLIVGYSTSETLLGGIGQDTIQAGDGDDILIGGIGNDMLEGGLGDDTFVFNIGDGRDTVLDSSGANTVQFGEGIAEGDLLFESNGVDLKITVNEKDSIRIADYFTASSYKIAQIAFADSSVMDDTAITARITADMTGVDETLSGTSATDVINGHAGDDSITAGDGADILIGGFGDDLLYGGYGDDTYLYNSGDGSDIIEDMGNTDTLIFDTGIKENDLSLSRVNSYDLQIDIDDGGSVLIKNHFTYTKAVESIQFDGGSYDLQDIRDIIIAQQSTNGDDNITGFDEADTLQGGLGNDSLYGGYGNDTYIYNSGDGSDYIYDDGGSDTLIFGAGITAGDLSFSRVSTYNLQIDVSGGGSVLIGNHFNYKSMETIAFDGGSYDQQNIRDIIIAQQTTSGNDSITGFDEADTLQGGLGDDALYGGYGNDTYIYNTGDGNDVVYDMGGADTLIFGTGITDGDLSFSQVNTDDLQIDIDGGGSVLIEDYFNYRPVETIMFDGGSYDQSDVLGLI